MFPEEFLSTQTGSAFKAGIMPFNSEAAGFQKSSDAVKSVCKNRM